MGKIKAEKDEAMDTSTIKEENTYDEKLLHVNEIATPMASKKLTKKCLKLVKKAMKHKNYIRNGIKEVQRFVRKGEKGIILLAGDVKPIDIYSHMPVVCEEKGIPYCFVPTRQDIGAAMGFKSRVVIVLIKEHIDYKEAFDELKEELTCLAAPA